MTDDLDGTAKDVRTFSFALDGKDYEIDLSKRNGDKFTRKLEPFVAAARKVNRNRGQQKPASNGAVKRSKDEMNRIREWARQKGHKVSERGRIAQPILDAYDASH